MIEFLPPNKSWLVEACTPICGRPETYRDDELFVVCKLWLSEGKKDDFSLFLLENENDRLASISPLDKRKRRWYYVHVEDLGKVNSLAFKLRRIGRWYQSS